MIEPPEVILTDSARVKCDGATDIRGGAALGHPRVWLSVPHETGVVECPYCDARIIHRSFEGKVD